MVRHLEKANQIPLNCFGSQLARKCPRGLPIMVQWFLTAPAAIRAACLVALLWRHEEIAGGGLAAHPAATYFLMG